jgi:hypothetical protein
MPTQLIANIRLAPMRYLVARFEMLERRLREALAPNNEQSRGRSPQQIVDEIFAREGNAYYMGPSPLEDFEKAIHALGPGAETGRLLALTSQLASRHDANGELSPNGVLERMRELLDIYSPAATRYWEARLKAVLNETE